MGRQSARMYFNGADHKEVYFNGSYHDAMYLTDSNANAELIWQKLQDSDYFSVRVIDYMVDYESGEMPSGGVGGYVAFNISTNKGQAYTIDWGDGTVTKNRNNHTYATGNGTRYTVKIYGESFQFSAPTAYANKICTCITEILTPIKRGMSVNSYDYENDVPSFASMFAYCSLLREIPEDLFKNVKDYEMVNCSGMFQYCGLSDIPTGLFSGVKNWMIGGFYIGCNGLLSIPHGAFTGGGFYPESSSRVFEQCANLRFVYDYPEGSLPTFTGTKVEVVDCFFKNVSNVNGLFNGLTTLTTVSDKLFKYCPEITSATYLFNDCANLKGIPEGLFDGLDLLEDVRYCFYGCSSVNSVPHDLFHDCYSITNFMMCFQGTNIEEIPSDLFASINGSQINFASTFQNTPIRAIPLGLFDGCKEDSNFQSTFMGCSDVVSNVPDLWNYSDNGWRCYNGCTNASNYDEIPDRWKNL